MAQLRKDPVTHRWVIVDVERPRQAEAFDSTPVLKSKKVCPFCPGNERMTPGEIFALGREGQADQDAPGWRLRVVPNKFPALTIEENHEKSSSGIYDRLGGFGAHEVIIETPDHDCEISEMEEGQVRLILCAFRDRCLDLRKDPRFKFILVFKNYGAAAGASLSHPHSQLIALPVVPSRVLGEIKGAVTHFEYAERCIYCDMLGQERSEKKLTVMESAGFVAFAPFASRFAFETWIMPKIHQARFDLLTDDQARDLAAVLKATLSKIRKALKDPSYNLMIHTLPIQGKEVDSFHWHIEIIPHLVRVAGFELGTGFYVNPTPPEIAAEALRMV